MIDYTSNIYVSVPGLKINKTTLFYFLEQRNLYKDNFYKSFNVQSIHGDLESTWSGGDLLYHSSDKFHNNIKYKFDESLENPLTDNLQSLFFVEPSRVQELFRVIDSHNIAVRLNYASPIIRDIDLQDQISNIVLTYIDKFKDMNTQFEISVSSNLLKDYIEKNYPKYKIYWDELLCETDINKINELSESNIVTLDTSFNNDISKLKQLKHPENIEIQLASPCIKDCPFKKLHYYNNSMYKKGYDVRELTSCIYHKVNKDEINPAIDNSFYTVEYKKPTFVTKEDIINIYLPLGINKFKIPETNQSTELYMEELLYYSVKEEKIDDMRLDYFLHFFRGALK